MADHVFGAQGSSAVQAVGVQAFEMSAQHVSVDELDGCGCEVLRRTEPETVQYLYWRLLVDVEVVHILQREQSIVPVA